MYTVLCIYGKAHTVCTHAYYVMLYCVVIYCCWCYYYIIVSERAVWRSVSMKSQSTKYSQVYEPLSRRSEGKKSPQRYNALAVYIIIYALQSRTYIGYNGCIYYIILLLRSCVRTATAYVRTHTLVYVYIWFLRAWVWGILMCVCVRVSACGGIYREPCRNGLWRTRRRRCRRRVLVASKKNVIHYCYCTRHYCYPVYHRCIVWRRRASSSSSSSCRAPQVVENDLGRRRTGSRSAISGLHRYFALYVIIIIITLLSCITLRTIHTHDIRSYGHNRTNTHVHEPNNKDRGRRVVHGAIYAVAGTMITRPIVSVTKRDRPTVTALAAGVTGHGVHGRRRRGGGDNNDNNNNNNIILDGPRTRIAPPPRCRRRTV